MLTWRQRANRPSFELRHEKRWKRRNSGPMADKVQVNVISDADLRAMKSALRAEKR